MNSGECPTSASRVAEIAGALSRAVAAAFRFGVMPAVTVLMVCRRIALARGVLLALEARFLAGGVMSRAGRTGAEVVQARGHSTSVEDKAVRIPRRFAWLCALVPGDAACYAGQLRVVLAEPGMVALLAACPQAVRAVRPLCRMLGIERAAFVPGLRVPVVAAPVAALAAEAPVAVRGSPALCDDDDGVSWAAQAAVGLGWLRFIPG
jgi:hypothetical protein